MVDVPRGFKAKANRIGIAVRHQMDLPPWAPIRVDALADRIGIGLCSLSSLAPTLPAEVSLFSGRSLRDFSGTLLQSEDSQHRLILYNDHHNAGRQNSSIAHEIAHALLAHPPVATFKKEGQRSFDSLIEAEANCLAEYLLITNEAAWHIAKTCMSVDSALNIYGVSQTMLNYRLRVSGAQLRLRRLRALLG